MSSTLGDPSSSQNQTSVSPIFPNLHQGLCDNCNSQPQRWDPLKGQYSNYCSDSCAIGSILRVLQLDSNLAGHQKTSTGVNANANASSVLDVCNHCMQRPRYTDGTTVHPYCGRTCAKLAKGKGPANVNAPAPTSYVNTANPFAFASPTRGTTLADTTGALGITPPTNPRNGIGSVNRRKSVRMPSVLTPIDFHTSSNTTRNNRSTVYWGSSAGQTCLIAGCEAPVYVGSNGFASKYCGRTHKQLGESGCISCRGAQTDGSIVFCRPCYDGLLYTAPTIVEVPRDHERYKSVESQFKQKWLHSKKCPQVRAIYKIVSTRTNVTKYERYLNLIEAKGKFTSKGKSRGNENRRWHGTTRVCNIGDKGVTRFCSNPSCSLCCIMRTSFDLSFFAKKTSFGRFGSGIYTSATSSKSDAYSQNSCISQWKAMLLNRVVVGKGYKLKVDNTALTAPPAGYDSVIAEVGARLNYDELVVYNNDAIRPSYLVMYDTPK